MFSAITIKTKISMIVLGMLVSLGVLLVGVSLIESKRALRDLTMTTLQSKLEGDLSSSRHKIAAHYGKLQLIDGVLSDSSGAAVDGRFEMVDEIKQELGDLATLFVRDGDDFRRVVTNVVNAEGKRAIGTMLGSKSAAYDQIRQKKTYIGTASILEKPYFTSYDPIFDDKKELVGILFIGIPMSDVNSIISSRISSLAISMIAIISVIIIICCIVSIVVIGWLLKPIGHISERLKDISHGEGDLTKRLPVTSRDEVGELAILFNVFIEKLQSLIKDISVGVQILATSSIELSSISTHMNQGIKTVSEKSEAVATASEEMTSNIHSVAAAMEESAANTNMLATASEEMSSTINEIARNAEKARDISDQASKKASSASENIDRLGVAAKSIGKVIETITDISEQVNLLALNATIEAARAGEAGKGFAVVANEIKELARQTADATQHIREKVEGIQGTTTITVAEIIEITGVIAEVNEVVTTIAAAVEEQSAATTEIAGNVAQVSTGIQEVNVNVNQSSSAVSEISKDIADVNGSMTEMSAISSQVDISASELSKLSEQLKAMVDQFKV